jgi:hypothetical protein
MFEIKERPRFPYAARTPHSMFERLRIPSAATIGSYVNDATVDAENPTC